jgi:hypothetical protein
MTSSFRLGLDRSRTWAKAIVRSLRMVEGSCIRLARSVRPSALLELILSDVTWLPCADASEISFHANECPSE